MIWRRWTHLQDLPRKFPTVRDSHSAAAAPPPWESRTVGHLCSCGRATWSSSIYKSWAAPHHTTQQASISHHGATQQVYSCHHALHPHSIFFRGPDLRGQGPGWVPQSPEQLLQAQHNGSTSISPGEVDNVKVLTLNNWFLTVWLYIVAFFPPGNCGETLSWH